VNKNKKWTDSKLVKKIIRYEEGNMLPKEQIEFFQYLVDSGIAWTLQGHYGRTAQDLIERGWIKDRQKEVDKK